MSSNRELEDLDKIIMYYFKNGYKIEFVSVTKEFNEFVQVEFLNGNPWKHYQGYPVQVDIQAEEISVHCKESQAVNKYKEKNYDVYIGRGSVWGNPFTHRELSKTKAEFQTTSREESINKYRDWILNQSQLVARIPELRGKTLACFCKPKSCHGDVLSDMANEFLENGKGVKRFESIEGEGEGY